MNLKQLIGFEGYCEDFIGFYQTQKIGQIFPVAINENPGQHTLHYANANKCKIFRALENSSHFHSTKQPHQQEQFQHINKA